MRTPLIVIALACLIGCALTPPEVREKGERFDMQVGRDPTTSAACAAKNAEIKSASLMATTRPGAQGMVELIVRNVGEGAQTLAVADFAIGKAVIWVTPNIMSAASFAADLVKGC